ncbi:MAG: BamA/TamA family outer membrane protein [Candidatus Sericytochromatia bacterium]|nr:BamA/TamA family outer membrane protein [Candidatus Sericytochromatia bacterium]
MTVTRHVSRVSMAGALALCLLPLPALAESLRVAAGSDAVAVPQASDVGASASDSEANVPDYVSRQRLLSANELAKKKIGWFVTGLPNLSLDPVSGVAAGFNGYLYYNGNRNDRLFAYTPYTTKLGIQLNQSQFDDQVVKLSLDAPFVWDSPWRVKFDMRYQDHPNKLYFGLTEQTLNPLPGNIDYPKYNSQLNGIRPGRGAGEVDQVTDVKYHNFREKDLMMNLKAERSLFDGNWRLLGGYELQHLTYSTFQGVNSLAVDPVTGEKRPVPNGASRLDEDVARGTVFGRQGGLVSLLQTTLMYDTRDFEPDPTSGMVFELGNEFSSPVIGSAVAFDKVLLMARTYMKLFPEHLKRTVLATRTGLGTIFGDQAPFFEFQDQWSAEGSVKALGGSQTLRGFKPNRFLGRTVAFANVELRHTFAEVDFWGQNLTFAVTPFVDAGAVGDLPFVPRLDKLQFSTGAGLRIGWNRSTIILIDAAISAEDRQLFLNFNNSF